jgi:hypothetical protein
VRNALELLAGIIFFAGVCAYSTVFYLEEFGPRPCELHTYTVVRLNPNLDPLIIPTITTGHNARLIITKFMACGYEHVDGKTVFFTDELRDTIADVVHVQDQGPIR